MISPSIKFMYSSWPNWHFSCLDPWEDKVSPVVGLISTWVSTYSLSTYSAWTATSAPVGETSDVLSGPRLHPVTVSANAHPHPAALSPPRARARRRCRQPLRGRDLQVQPWMPHLPPPKLSPTLSLPNTRHTPQLDTTRRSGTL